MRETRGSVPGVFVAIRHLSGKSVSPVQHLDGFVCSLDGADEVEIAQWGEVHLGKFELHKSTLQSVMNVPVVSGNPLPGRREVVTLDTDDQLHSSTLGRR